VEEAASAAVDSFEREVDSGDTAYSNANVTPCQEIVYWLSIRTIRVLRSGGCCERHFCRRRAGAGMAGVTRKPAFRWWV